MQTVGDKVEQLYWHSFADIDRNTTSIRKEQEFIYRQRYLLSAFSAIGKRQRNSRHRNFALALIPINTARSPYSSIRSNLASTRFNEIQLETRFAYEFAVAAKRSVFTGKRYQKIKMPVPMKTFIRANRESSILVALLRNPKCDLNCRENSARENQCTKISISKRQGNTIMNANECQTNANKQIEIYLGRCRDASETLQGKRPEVDRGSLVYASAQMRSHYCKRRGIGFGSAVRSILCTVNRLFRVRE